MTGITLRNRINALFRAHLEKVTGEHVREVCLTSNAISIMGSRKAIDAVKELPFTFANEEYDQEHDAWFIEIPIL